MLYSKGLTQGNHYKRIQIVGCKVYTTCMYLTVSLLKSDGITFTTASTALEGQLHYKMCLWSVIREHSKHSKPIWCMQFYSSFGSSSKPLVELIHRCVNGQHYQ